MATYLLVDGENIDATLGMSVLNRRPTSEERPRWDRVAEFAAGLGGGDLKALFFLNATGGQLPAPFIAALIAMGYHPIPLAGEGKVVDIGIQRTLQALRDRDGDVVLASHDGDFVEDLEPLLGRGRQVAVLAFREFLSGKLADLTSRGLSVFDLEMDARAFNTTLPRVRIIALEDFDPLVYL